ncbi:hypothetical protein FSP39_016052 [Pinctada imbricata]|uniref:Solute carrier family 25 member 51 n=1 Tax=Pinctada imbricata TaxID=66713 RepID=A0AA88XPM4_PINIB|nr:hypothetical protein FSP39_016052 [Pinctada imbricata]
MKSQEDQYGPISSYGPNTSHGITHFSEQRSGTVGGNDSKDHANRMALSGTDSVHHEFVCGWGAAFINICVTFPINKVMFRQQLTGDRVLKAISGLQKEGLRNVYRGLPPPLMQKTFSMSLMFGTYYQLEAILHQRYPQHWVVTKTTAATTAGLVEAVLTPFERVQVLMQDKNYQSRFQNTLHAFRDLRQYGLKEYYRGLSTIIFRNCSSNILFFIARDLMMENLPKPDSNYQRVGQDFLCGACLGAFLSTVYYPLNVVKVRLQCKLGGKFLKFSETFRVILQERKSVKKLFRGVHINYTRSFISWGIINAAYEILMNQLFGKSSRLAEKKPGA